MDYTQSNKQKVLDYLLAGSKGGDLGLIGVELEHFVMDEDGCTVPYIEKNGRLGISDILEQLSKYYPEVVRDEEGHPLACSRPGASITIEPAAQIEISISPCLSIKELEDEYNRFRFRLEQIVEPYDYTVQNFGYNPHDKVSDLHLIPKKRYKYMDEYMDALPGMHPQYMMRGTASTQISIDFANEVDAVRKLRIATLLGPIFSYIASNSPVFEAHANDQILRRLNVWRQVDNARCGTIPHLFDDDFSFEKYVDWLFDTPPIITTINGKIEKAYMSASLAYANVDMNKTDIEHLLSMFWPDVRLKKYIEIRVADSMPPQVALSYVALLKGIFYNYLNLEILEDKLFGTVSVQDLDPDLRL
ncbi:MAG: glutamate-cysteine ligase family protein, partial [Coriobacteriales bacterium]|nr:glutamate-cysteine ligase family protein [Coriobacteriales bacterium]